MIETRRFVVWFYIGVVLATYGVLLLGGGVYQWLHPPTTVLAGFHATFWAGVLLLLAGAFYTVIYWPRSIAPPMSTTHGNAGATK